MLDYLVSTNVSKANVTGQLEGIIASLGTLLHLGIGGSVVQ